MVLKDLKSCTVLTSFFLRCLSAFTGSLRVLTIPQDKDEILCIKIARNIRIRWGCVATIKIYHIQRMKTTNIKIIIKSLHVGYGPLLKRKFAEGALRRTFIQYFCFGRTSAVWDCLYDKASTRCLIGVRLSSLVLCCVRVGA